MSALLVASLVACGTSHEASDPDASDDASDPDDAGRMDDARTAPDTRPFYDCFVAGTLVATPLGDVPIERVRAGDRVWSYDEANERRVAAEVERTFRHSDSSVFPMRLSDGRELQVTAEHPIYAVAEAQYMPAADMEGRSVLGLDGERVSVAELGNPRLVEVTYNLQVAGHHNYFAEGVLVHNKTDIPPPPPEPTTCECCGTTVTLGRGDVCPSDVCDPYCAGCAAPPLDVVCFEMPMEDTAFTLDVVATECTCGTTLECVVGVNELDRVVELNVAACTDPEAECTECTQAVASCSIPPLDVGTWRFRVNGQREFEDHVSGGIARNPLSICLTSTTDPMPDCPYGEDRGFVVDEYCYPSEARTGERVAVTVKSCAPCGEVGACITTIDEDRGVVLVGPRQREPTCDITCPDECEERVDTCFTPPLEAGTYTLSVAGVESTIEIREDPMPTEVCGSP